MSAVPASRPPKDFYRPRFLLVVTGFTLLFMLLPVILVVVYSVNDTRSLTTFSGVSLRWYRTLLNDDTAISAVKTSVEIAVGATLASLVLGTLLAVGLVRVHRAAARPTEAVVGLNLIAPEIATAVALLLLFSRAHVTLSLWTTMIGHITFAIAYVTIIMRSRLLVIPRELEEGARDLGSGRVGALTRVVLPQLVPALVGVGCLVFLFSFDDFVTSFFTTGVGAQPLPVFIYGMIRFGVTPEINAIGTAMMALTIVLGIIGTKLVSLRPT